MNPSEVSATAFLVATAAHAGFQLTVTTLVYPTLVRVGPDHWEQAHARHSRGIVPLVVVLYAALVVSSIWCLAYHHGPAAWLGAGAAWATMLVTASVAAPTHGRLVTPEPALLRRLLVADRWRAAFACLALAGAILVVLAG